MFSKNVLPVLLYGTLTFALTACGGGSDNNDEPQSQTPPVSDTPPTTPPDDSMGMVSKRIGGQVTYLDENNNTLNVTDLFRATDIDIRVLDASGAELSATTTQLNSAVDAARFEADISIPTEKGSVVVNIERQGFAGYSKRYDFESGDAINLALIGELKRAQTTRFQVQDNVTVSGKRMEGFSFSVTRKADGKTALKGGMSQQATAGEEDVLSVVVPASAVPAGVDELTATVRNFDPNDAQDSSSFPGAYADSDGNTLLSVAFDFADVSMPDGTSMQKYVAEKRALAGSQKTSANDEPVIINRAIPAASCSALESIGDADADMVGFQVPVYTYNPNSGLWDLLGKGTVYDAAGTMVAEDQSVFDCSVDRYTLEVEVTNEIFLSNWWNLDYPLVFDEPVQACANIELRNTEGQPINQSIVWVFDDDEQRSFSQDYIVVDENGRARIEAIVIDGSDDRTVRLQVWDSFITGSNQTREITLSDNCDDTEEVTVVTVERPQLCDVQGRVAYEDGSVPNELPIYGIGEGLFSFDYTTTRDDGTFSLNLACETPLTITSLFTPFIDAQQSIMVNVNGEVETAEQSDNGSTVVLQDLVVAPSPPIGFVGNGDGTNGPQYDTITLTAFDIDGSYPLNYAFTIIDQQDNVVGSFDGTISEPDEDGGIFTALVTLDFTTPDNAQYTVRGTIRDSTNQESALTGFIFGRNAF